MARCLAERQGVALRKAVFGPTGTHAAMGNRLRATLMDVAKAANVSVTTVSNLVNGRLHLMSEETRHRIEAAIRTQNYRPNQEARNLRLAERRTVGLIVVDDSPTYLADPMTTNIVAGLSNTLGVNGYSLLITGLPHAAVGGALMLRRQQTDAICVFPSGPVAERRRLYQQLGNLTQPVVAFQDKAPAEMQDTFSIFQDDRKAGRLIGERALQRGARRILFLMPAQSWPALVSRQEGIEEAVAAQAVVDVPICDSESAADTRLAMERYMERHKMPDMVIGGNDQMAISAMNWALDRQFAVPGDLRFAGFNGFEVFGYARPALTTIVSPAYEMGRRGAEALIERLASGSFPAQSQLFDVALREGGSD